MDALEYTSNERTQKIVFEEEKILSPRREEEIGFHEKKRQCKDNIGNCSRHQAATVAAFGEKISTNESSSFAFFCNELRISSSSS